MGKVQRRILERLQQAGSFQSVHDLAYYVYEIEDGAPTRAQLVAVRRAVKQLTDSGMVESGMLSHRDYGGRLSCWLPSARPPGWARNTRYSGADVEAAILKAVEDFDAKHVEEWLREAYNVSYADRCRWQNGCIPYGYLVKHTARAMGQTYASGSYVASTYRVAFNRAIRRLVASGRLDGSIRIKPYSLGTVCTVMAPRAPAKVVAS